ncbi:MAG: A/G-specific adenine glycosylase [Bacteroidales bacterium]
MTQTIIEWYLKHKRDLPWRDTQDPYLIWISEIILQQTRVAQGYDYYLRFISQFPAIKNLSEAPEEEVLRMWQGLGYYSRARNIHATAKDIMARFDGKFPSTYDDIISLRGIGPYTAAAIASFAFRLPHAAVDGNVYRVISRLFGIITPIDTNEGKKLFQAIAEEMMDPKHPDLFNQAMMEFGAIQCTPKAPDCTSCPLSDKCIALEKGIINELPVKQGKTKVRPRFFHFIEIGNDEELWIEQRQSDDIWKGLFQLPLIETAENTPLLNTDLSAVTGNARIESFTLCKEYKHVLSHQHLYCRFYKLKGEYISLNEPFRKIRRDELNNYAIPRIIERYFEENI